MTTESKTESQTDIKRRKKSLLVHLTTLLKTEQVNNRIIGGWIQKEE
jgi:hypothetical protein